MKLVVKEVKAKKNGLLMVDAGTPAQGVDVTLIWDPNTLGSVSVGDEIDEDLHFAPPVTAGRWLLGLLLPQRLRKWFRLD